MDEKKETYQKIENKTMKELEDELGIYLTNSQQFHSEEGISSILEEEN